MSVSPESRNDLERLLLLAGAKPARTGKRWDCPECGSPGHVSVDSAKEAYHCWHAGCGFRGYRRTLEKRLGIERRLTEAQRREWSKALHESQRAAEWLAEELHALHLRLAALHRRLLTMQYGAAKRLGANADNETAWACLATAHRNLPLVHAALLLVEDAPIRQRLEYLNASPRQRKEIAWRTVERCGLIDSHGRFLELSL